MYVCVGGVGWGGVWVVVWVVVWVCYERREFGHMNAGAIDQFLHESFTFYRPQTKMRKGNVFTRICQEFCPQGDACNTPWADTPLAGRHPPWQADTPLGRHTPSGQTPPSSTWLLQRTTHILLECICFLKITLEDHVSGTDLQI